MAFNAGQKLRASHFGQLTTTARYQASGSQTISHNTVTVKAFDTALQTTSLVTRATSGAGHSFTLNAGGLWYAGTNIRWSAAATGVREIWLEQGGVRMHSHGFEAPSANRDVQLFCSTLRWFNSGDVVTVGVYQDSGANRSITQNVGFGWTLVEFAYILGEGP